ncbi:hypothetical protein AAHA92_18971 [Salvia divinorum]|uniref:Transmembrane protein n=1 Tax=Salvia divinorum TaxID=28513 RepID=A0ABD1H3U1_SALDI
MSTQSRPSLWRVLSDTSRIISSNSLHFAALSLLFIFPITLFNLIHALILPPSPFNFQIPSFGTSLILPKLLYGLALLIFNIFSVSSVTHSIFHAFHRNPIKISSSLKSILPSFLPLLATKLAYFIVAFFDISLGFGICMCFVWFGRMALGLEIGTTSRSFTVVVFAMTILFFGLLVECCLMDAVVVVESKYGFAPLQRSSTLVKGMRHVAFLMIALPVILQGIISWRFLVLGGGDGGVFLQLAVCAVLSTALTLFGVAATTVLFIHCKALNGESEELEFQDKLGAVYVQLTRDVAELGLVYHDIK